MLVRQADATTLLARNIVMATVAQKEMRYAVERFIVVSSILKWLAKVQH
jgi:hypothetical protein